MSNLEPVRRFQRVTGQSIQYQTRSTLPVLGRHRRVLLAFLEAFQSEQHLCCQFHMPKRQLPRPLAGYISGQKSSDLQHASTISEAPCALSLVEIRRYAGRPARKTSDPPCDSFGDASSSTKPIILTETVEKNSVLWICDMVLLLAARFAPGHGKVPRKGGTLPSSIHTGQLDWNSSEGGIL